MPATPRGDRHRCARPPRRRPAAPAGSTWRRSTVDGHRVRYGVVGTGPGRRCSCTGGGCGPTPTGRPIEAMAAAGCRVVAPALPGFGGTRELPAEAADLRRLRRLGRPVPRRRRAWATWPWWPATRSAAGCRPPSSTTSPGGCGSLLLANAIGSPTWALFPNEVRTMVQRPFWDWGRHFGTDLLHSPRCLRLLPTLLEDFIPNLVRNPLGHVPHRRVHPPGRPGGRGPGHRRAGASR